MTVGWQLVALRHAPAAAEAGDSAAAAKLRAAGARPFRDNTKLLLVGIAVLVAALAGLLALASRSAALAPDFLTEFVLYALSATNLTMLVALVFVLARNIIKLLVERRRALPFARFRAKLVAVLLGMTLIPAVLVLIVGSELIRNSVDRWFNAPMDDVLSSANAIAGDYYQERQRLVVGAGAAPGARAGRRRSRRRRPADACATSSRPTCSRSASSLVEVYRVERAGAAAAARSCRSSTSRRAVAAARVLARGRADRLARARGRATAPTAPVVEPLPDGGELIRSGGADPLVAGRARARAS